MSSNNPRFEITLMFVIVVLLIWTVLLVGAVKPSELLYKMRTASVYSSQ